MNATPRRSRSTPASPGGGGSSLRSALRWSTRCVMIYISTLPLHFAFDSRESVSPFGLLPFTSLSHLCPHVVISILMTFVVSCPVDGSHAGRCWLYLLEPAPYARRVHDGAAPDPSRSWRRPRDAAEERTLTNPDVLLTTAYIYVPESATHNLTRSPYRTSFNCSGPAHWLPRAAPSDARPHRARGRHAGR